MNRRKKKEEAVNSYYSTFVFSAGRNDENDPGGKTRKHTRSVNTEAEEFYKVSYQQIQRSFKKSFGKGKKNTQKKQTKPGSFVYLFR